MARPSPKSMPAGREILGVKAALTFSLSPVLRGEGWGEGTAIRRKAYYADWRIGPLTLPSPLSTGERVLSKPPYGPTNSIGISALSKSAHTFSRHDIAH